MHFLGAALTCSAISERILLRVASSCCSVMCWSGRLYAGCWSGRSWLALNKPCLGSPPTAWADVCSPLAPCRSRAGLSLTNRLCAPKIKARIVSFWSQAWVNISVAAACWHLCGCLFLPTSVLGCGGAGGPLRRAFPFCVAEPDGRMRTGVSGRGKALSCRGACPAFPAQRLLQASSCAREAAQCAFSLSHTHTHTHAPAGVSLDPFRLLMTCCKAPGTMDGPPAWC